MSSEKTPSLFFLFFCLLLGESKRYPVLKSWSLFTAAHVALEQPIYRPLVPLSLSLSLSRPSSPIMIWLSTIVVPALARLSAFLRPKAGSWSWSFKIKQLTRANSSLVEIASHPPQAILTLSPRRRRRRSHRRRP